MWVPFSLVRGFDWCPNQSLTIAYRQCLLDVYSMNECPNCGIGLTSNSSTGEQQILCNLKNEGGLQERLDILPLLTEEMYLKAYPEERRCQAFLEFCGEGDIEAIVDILNDDGEVNEDGGEMPEGKRVDVLRYQDQIRTMNSGLHVAIQNMRTDVAWLLLLLASKLDVSKVPTKVLDAAKNLDLDRDDQTGKVDIRDLRDSEGMTANQRASMLGGIWQEWVASGMLEPPG